MTRVSARLTIVFEHPFWVGIFERMYDDKLEVAKVTFGAEPKDDEIYSFILTHFHHLTFSPPITAELANHKKLNPKRLQRLVKKQASETGIGKKAQQALKLQQEQQKMLRKHISKQQRDVQKQRKFELKQLKRHEKHKGH